MPANGLALVAHGAVHVYERNSTCELVADLLFPEGVGLAQMQGERVYRQLEAEGLFSTSRKRRCPRLPRRIGIVSSERGAVIHDLLSVLERRFPLAEVVFVPAPVQGPGAAAAMAQAVGRLGRWQRDGAGVDVLVVARGGGSDDDLAAFNDERLARAIFASPVPVVSAVGHETNLTLADLVADLRAPTPSAAAELLAPDVDRAATRRQRACDAALVHRRIDSAVRPAQRAPSTDLRASRCTRSGPTRHACRAATPSSKPAAASCTTRQTLRQATRLRIRLHRGQLTSTVDAVEPDA